MTAALKNSQGLRYTIVVNPKNGTADAMSFEKNITIGRLPENDVVISNDPRVSRQHVKVEIEGESLKLSALNKKNPIIINDKEVTYFYVNSEECLVNIGKSQFKINIQQSFGKAEVVPLEPLPVPGSAGVLRPHQSPVGQALPQHPPGNLSHRQAASPAARAKKAKGRRPAPKKSGSNKLILYIVVAAVIGGGYFYLQEEPQSSPPKGIRTTEEIQADLARAQMQMDEVKRHKQESGEDSKMYDSAQAYYVRGFRDYRQGQFRRALQSFQAALSFYPEHKLARQYMNLAEIQADRMDRANMQQGRKYRDRGHFNLCVSAFQKVMTSLKDPENTVYKEAKVLHDECQTLAEGRY